MRRSSRCVNHQINYNYAIESGLGSSVSIVAGYGLDGPEIESRWGGEIFRARPDGPKNPLQWVPGFWAEVKLPEPGFENKPPS